MDSGTFFDDMRVEACLSFLWGPSVLGGVNQEGNGVIQPIRTEAKQEKPISTALTVVCGCRFKIQRPQMDEIQKRQFLRVPFWPGLGMFLLLEVLWGSGKKTGWRSEGSGPWELGMIGKVTSVARSPFSSKVGF